MNFRCAIECAREEYYPHVYLLYIYIDDLSIKLNGLGIGCCINNKLINHLMYADDMVLLAQATSALQQLLRECHNFGNAHDMLFNP